MNNGARRLTAATCLVDGITNFLFFVFGRMSEMQNKHIIITACVILSALLMLTSNVLGASSAEDILRLYKAGDYSKVTELGTTYLEGNPEDGTINYYVGEALLRQSEPLKAMKYLLKAISRYDENPELFAHAYYIMALCQYYSGNKEEAEKLLEECVKKNGSAETTQYAVNLMRTLNLKSYFDDWTILETKHFIFHFHPSFTRSQIDGYSKKLEDVYEKINAVLSSKPNKKLDDYVWDSLETLKIQKAGSAFTPGFLTYPDFCMMDSGFEKAPEKHLAILLTYWANPHTDLLDTMGKMKEIPFIYNGTYSYFADKSSIGKVLAKWATLLAFRNGFLPEPSIEAIWNDESKVNYPDWSMREISGSFIDLIISKAGVEKFRLLLKEPTYLNAKSIYGDQFSSIIRKFEERYKANYIALIVLVLVLVIILSMRLLVKRHLHS